MNLTPHYIKPGQPDIVTNHIRVKFSNLNALPFTILIFSKMDSSPSKFILESTPSKNRIGGYRPKALYKCSVFEFKECLACTYTEIIMFNNATLKSLRKNQSHNVSAFLSMNSIELQLLVRQSPKLIKSEILSSYRPQTNAAICFVFIFSTLLFIKV